MHKASKMFTNCKVQQFPGSAVSWQKVCELESYFSMNMPSYKHVHYEDKIDGLVQDCSISSASAMEILLSSVLHNGNPYTTKNKANLRDLIAATGLVILLKLDSNRRFFSRETPNLGQNRRFFSRVTLKYDGWPSKTIGHLFYATSSFVQHFVAIGEFKLELQSGNAQSRSKSTIFIAVWPWNLTDDLEKQ